MRVHRVSSSRYYEFDYTSAYWLSTVLPFDQWSHVSFPGLTLRTLTIFWAVFFVFFRFKLFWSCLSTNCPTVAYSTSSRLGYFSFTVQPMASRQLSLANVADSDRLS